MMYLSSAITAMCRMIAISTGFIPAFPRKKTPADAESSTKAEEPISLDDLADIYRLNCHVEELGTGACGEVSAYGEYVFKTQVDEERALREASTMEHLKQNPSAVTYVGSFEVSEKYVIVMERMDCDLFTRLNMPYNPDCIMYICRDILEALVNIHKAQVAHMDIKLENILLRKDDKIKFCDFGFSKMGNEVRTMTQDSGTLEYIAPEIFNPDASYNGFYADVFSLGIVFHLMHLRKHLRKNVRMHTPGDFSVKAVLKKHESDYKNKQFFDLVDWMTEDDPVCRPTAEEALITFDRIIW